MQTVLEALREIVGQPDFYRVLEDGRSAAWDYGLMLEYLVASIVLLVAVSFVFKFLLVFAKGGH